MDIQRCLIIFMPGVPWSITNNDYSTLIMHDSTPMPTIDQLKAWQQQLDVQDTETLYQKQRQAEYPSINDLSVALWEQLIENRPEAAIALQTQREAIKAKYPKPQ